MPDEPDVYNPNTDPPFPSRLMVPPLAASDNLDDLINEDGTIK